jgi:exosortase
MDVALGVALIVALGWLYGPTVSALGSEWLSSADSSYGLVLCAVAGLLVWRRRAVFLSRLRPSASPTIGVAVLACGVALYLVGMLGADVFLTRVSAVVILTGVIGVLAGAPSTRVMAAPLFFLLLAIPPPTLAVTALTLPLQMVASRIGELTLLLVRVPVVRDGNLLRLPSATLEVAEACSGLRSLCSLGALAVLLAWATEQSWPRRAVIMAASIPIAVVVNGLRVAVTGIACELWGRAAAADPWHTLTGWLTFVVSMALLVSLQRLLGLRITPAGDLHPAMRRA